MLNWKKLYSKLLEMDKIVLSTHENPDGDGLGSACAMLNIISKMNIECKIISSTNFSKQYNFLNNNDQIEVYDRNVHYDWVSNADGAIIFDVGDYRRLREVGDILNEQNIYTVNIDHHPNLNDERFNDHFVDISAAATGEMVYEFIRSNNIDFNLEMAQGIYTAVMTDTGSFRHSNTNQRCHKIAMECIDLGVDVSKIYQDIYENRSISQVNLLSSIIKDLQFELDGELAWFVISQDLMNNSNATKSDVDGFTDFIRTLEGVEVSLMILESEKSNYRINFRSKGRYVINDVAKILGGGGHKFACGARVDGHLNDVISDIVDKTKQSIISQRKN